MSTADVLRDQVRERYALAAKAASAGSCGCSDDGGCCGNVACDGEDGAFGERLYSIEQRAQLSLGGTPRRPASRTCTSSRA